MKHLFLLMTLMIGGNVYSQGIDCSNLFNPTTNVQTLDSMNMGEITYKVQVISSSYVDITKFGKVSKTYRCAIDYCMLPSGKEVYRYLVEPITVNSLDSALKLMEEMNKKFENPFIVIYKKGKRIN